MAIAGVRNEGIEECTMLRQAVSSSNLQSVGYDPVSRILEIEFHDGRVYRYSGVPESVHRGLMGAASKGSHFADFIKDHYTCVRVL
jgi:hypothetical protein